MAQCFINGIGSVCTQDMSIDLSYFKELREPVNRAFKPNYKEFISPAMIRRMAAGVKMGVVASGLAMKEASVDMPSAVITGSGLGCLSDSEKFLNDIIVNKEQFLTPTSFIQSTHNTVAAQIALGLKCKAYNVTYVHGGTSFESALLDGLLHMNDALNDILVGGVDEIGSYTSGIYSSIGWVKNQDEIERGLLDSRTNGTILGEGAQFFILQNENKPTTYAELIDVNCINHTEETLLPDKVRAFLNSHSLLPKDIDLVILGLNGDAQYDSIYRELAKHTFYDAQHSWYKHLSGDYDSSSSFAFWMACDILKKQRIPSNIKLNDKNLKRINHVLIYSQQRGGYHGLILLKAC